MTARIALVGAWLIVATAGVALAQTPAGSTPAAPKRERELSVGGLFTGPASMGSSNAVLLGSNGTPSVTLFSTDNQMSFGAGAEAILGFHLRRALWVEVSGQFLKANLSSRISNDFENAGNDTISSPATRFAAEGAVLWYLRSKGKMSWFVRGAGGFMRETSGELTLAQSGAIVDGGVGVKYWWRTNGRGTFRKIGLRAEFRGEFRAGGVTLSERSATFGPAGAVHLVFGY